MIRHADHQALETLVTGIIRASKHANRLNGVEVNVGGFDDAGEFIRVVVHLKDLDDLPEDDVDTLASSIEGAVTIHDDRLPSIRFTNA